MIAATSLSYASSSRTSRAAKRRPVLVLSGPEYHSGRQEVVVAAVTSNVSRLLPGDHLVAGWRRAGLPQPSVATGILRTIKRAMIERTIGKLPAADLRAVQNTIRATLGL